MRPSHLSKRLQQYAAFGVHMGRHLTKFGWGTMRMASGRGDKPGYLVGLTEDGQKVALHLRKMEPLTKVPPKARSGRT